MSQQERIAATAQGAMTGLFDDFFDKTYLSDENILSLMNSEDATAKRSSERLFRFFFKKALQQVPDKQSTLQALLKVYQAQLESKKQTTGGITFKETEHITRFKGGTSLLFYRSAFLPVPLENEKSLLYALGGLMQLCNDIFDVYKDREQGIRTLLTETNSVERIRRMLSQDLHAAFKQAYATGIPTARVRCFLSILSLGIFSRAFVCLDQLEKNEIATSGKFVVQQYSRKQLICDMDTWKNKYQSLKYHSNLMTLRND